MVRVEKPCPRRPGAEVGEGRAGDAPGVDPDVLPEVLVLHRDDGVAQDGGDVPELDHHPLLDRELAEHAAVGGEDLRDDVGLEVLERRDLGQVALEGEEDADERPAEDGGREERGHHDAAQGQGAGGRQGLVAASPRRPARGAPSGTIMTGRPPGRQPGRAAAGALLAGCRGGGRRRGRRSATRSSRRPTGGPASRRPRCRGGRGALRSARGWEPPELLAAAARPIAAGALAPAARAATRWSSRRSLAAADSRWSPRRRSAGARHWRRGSLLSVRSAAPRDRSIPGGAACPRRSPTGGSRLRPRVPAAPPSRARPRGSPSRAACTTAPCAGSAAARPRALPIGWPTRRRVRWPGSSRRRRRPTGAARRSAPRRLPPAAARSRASTAPGSSSCCRRPARARSRRASAAG